MIQYADAPPRSMCGAFSLAQNSQAAAFKCGCALPRSEFVVSSIGQAPTHCAPPRYTATWSKSDSALAGEVSNCSSSKGMADAGQ